MRKSILKMIGNVDEKRLRDAFKGVSEDMAVMNKKHEDLKMNVHEWIRYLEAQNQMLLEKVEKLERTKAPRVIEL